MPNRANGILLFSVMIGMNALLGPSARLVPWGPLARQRSTRAHLATSATRRRTGPATWASQTWEAWDRWPNAAKLASTSSRCRSVQRQRGPPNIQNHPNPERDPVKSRVIASTSIQIQTSSVDRPLDISVPTRTSSMASPLSCRCQLGRMRPAPGVCLSVCPSAPRHRGCKQRQTICASVCLSVLH
jgi:hypothetical protein